MAKLFYTCLWFVTLFLMSCVISEDESSTNDSESSSEQDMEIITVSKLSECEKPFEPLDVGIFDVDTWYQVGERTEHSQSEGQEKVPFTVQLGKRKMLKSVEKAITGMCVGEHRKVTIPPHLAFGNKTIKFNDGREELRGGATLISDFKLLQIIRNTEDEIKKAFRMMDIDDNDKIDDDEIQTMVDIYRTVLGEDRVKETEQMMSDMFKSLDKNEDGSITLEEFRDSQQSEASNLSETKIMNTILKSLIRPKGCPACSTAATETCPDPLPCSTCDPRCPAKSQKIKEEKTEQENPEEMETTAEKKDKEREKTEENQNIKDEL